MGTSGSRHDRHHDVNQEPHLRNRDDETMSDGADESHRLDEEPVRATSPDAVQFDAEDVADHGVFDEPAWKAQSRVTGATRTGPDFAAVFAERRVSTTMGIRLLVFAGVMLVAGPTAVLSVFIDEFASGLGNAAGVFSIVVLTPVVEEMAKVAVLLWIVERRPWLVLNAVGILVMGAAGGFGFGVIENFFYLNIYYPDAGSDLAAWRWGITMPMHAIASTIASIGVVLMWRHVVRHHQQAPIPLAFPWLVGAMVLHGTYNGFALLTPALGIGPGNGS